MTATLPFTGLQDWYLRGSDGELEPTYDIQIDTLEEPGWSLCITLAGTALAGRQIPEMAIERTQSDWIHAWTDDHALHIDCGPLNLTEAIRTFTTWAHEGAPARAEAGSDPPRAWSRPRHGPMGAGLRREARGM